MLILCRVCAEFTDRFGRTVFTVRPRDLLSFLDAPEEIRSDPLFDMMLRDGSLEAVRSVEERTALENDPEAGITAEGRKVPEARNAEAEAPDPAPGISVPGAALHSGPEENSGPGEAPAASAAEAGASDIPAVPDPAGEPEAQEASSAASGSAASGSSGKPAEKENAEAEPAPAKRTRKTAK